MNCKGRAIFSYAQLYYAYFRMETREVHEGVNHDERGLEALSGHRSDLHIAPIIRPARQTHASRSITNTVKAYNLNWLLLILSSPFPLKKKLY